MAQAEAGDPMAQFLQAHRAHTGKVGWLRRAADGGFGRAMNELGMAYRSGPLAVLLVKACDARRMGEGGLPQDEAQAEWWFRRAVNATVLLGGLVWLTV